MPTEVFPEATWPLKNPKKLICNKFVFFFSGIYYADLLGKKNVKIVRVEGFRITEELDYAGRDDEKDS